MHRRSKRVLTGLGLVIVALAGIYAVLLVRATAQLRQAYADLERDGRPIRASEIVPPQVSDSDNAAVLYQSAILVLKGEPAGEKSLYERLMRHLPGVKKDAETDELLGREAVTNALSLVEQGTRRPACQLAHDYADSLHSYDAPVMEDMRNIVFLMGARARLEAEAGRPDRAWDLIVTQLRFGDSLRLDPIYDTQFVRLSAAMNASRTIRWLCETAPPDREHVQVIENLLKRQDDISLLVRAVDAERVLIGEWFFKLPKNELEKVLRDRGHNKDNIIPPALLRAMQRLSFRLVAFRPRLVADHAAYLQLMRKRVQLLQGPYRSHKETGPLMQPSVWNFLAYELGNAGSRDREFYCRFMADLRVTRAGLALLLYKQAHGALPPALDRLGLEGLVDPFTEKPLPYRPEGEGFVVYSVGADLKDNGGAPRPENQDSDPRRKPVEYDQVWRFPSPKSQAAAGGS